MFCPNCGQPYDDGAPGCPRCGAPNPGGQYAGGPGGSQQYAGPGGSGQYAGPGGSQQYAGGPGGQPANSDYAKRAVMVFILGILSIVVPFAGLVTGIIAVVMGSQLKGNEMRNTSSYGLANAGWIMGIVGLCIQAVRWIF